MIHATDVDDSLADDVMQQCKKFGDVRHVVIDIQKNVSFLSSCPTVDCIMILSLISYYTGCIF